MPRTIHNFENLRDLIDVSALPKDSAPAYTTISIPDMYGVLLEEDSGITETRVFVTEFSPGDVEYFMELLSSTPPQQHRYDLENILARDLKDWCWHHDQQCPYEPFLLALKATDGFLGSLTGELNTRALRAVGGALYQVWDDEDPLYRKVLRNVLTNWDWYQPAHAMLALYENLTSVNEDEIDQVIREKWLYRALYSITAYYCLCRKRKSTENIRALMNFVSQDSQRDMNRTEITVGNKLQGEMKPYFENASEEEFAVGKTFYTDALYNCSRNARRIFDEIFGPGGSGEVDKIISEWKQADTDGKKILHRSLRAMFQKDSNTASEIIDKAGHSDMPDLIRAAVEITEQQEFSFETQFYLREMAKYAGFCEAYAQYVTRKHEECRGEIKDDESFVYGCAFCLMGHPEMISGLFEALFLNSLGQTNGRYIFFSIRNVYLNQFTEQVEALVSQCLEDNEKALSLVLACSKIYSSRNAVAYPASFDRVCEQLLSLVKLENTDSPRCASALMDLYERIVNYQNRSRYERSLQAIIGTEAPSLHTARQRAAGKVRAVYGSL